MDNYFYTGQVRRFLTQFIRMISNFQIRLGRDRDGISTLLRIPVYYGDSSRQVAAILAKNSENSLPAVPAMSTHITALRYDRARVQNPTHVSKMQIRERAYDPDSGSYSDLQGDLLTIERLMPVPYTITIALDIWTTNTDQKLQLIEQIGAIFNPSLEIQSTDAYVDWTSLSVITLTDINFSSRTVPVGPEDPIDVATLTFELPIWLSAPAKVKRQGVIHKIIASVYDPDGLDPKDDSFDITGSILATRQIYTPTNLNLVYLGNTLKLYVNDSEIEFNDGSVPAMREGDWHLAVRSFGELSGANQDLLQNGISQIRLYNDGIVVVGTVAYHPIDPTLLIFNVDLDTLPTNTMPPINAVIDPANLKPNPLITTPTLGTRFLILNPIGSDANTDSDPATIDGARIWNRLGQPQLIAVANDIIEWDGFKWTVAFDSQDIINIQSIQYVTNLNTGIQYKWKNQVWSKSVEGRYGVGAWSFVPT